MQDSSRSPMARCCYRVGRALGVIGWHRGALQSYRDAVRFDTRFALAHFGQGEELAALLRWREAAAAFERASDLRPSDVEIQGNRVFALFQAALYDETAAAIERLARLRPDQQDLHLLLGAVLRRANRHAEAMRAFRWAVRLPPRTDDRRFHLGVALLGPREWDEVLESCRAARTFEDVLPSTVDVSGRRSELQTHPGASVGEYYRLTSRRTGVPPGLGARVVRWLGLGRRRAKPAADAAPALPFPEPDHRLVVPRATTSVPARRR